MRSRGLSFADAVRLLDGDSPTVTRFGQVAGVAAGTVTVASAGTVDFFALRDQVVRWGNSAVLSWRDKVEGLSRFDRTDRLIAAHSVIVLVAFFEALEEMAPSSPQLAAAEQVAISSSRPTPKSFTEIVTVLIEQPAPHPTPQRPFESFELELTSYYVGLSSTTVSVLGLTDVEIRELARLSGVRYTAAYRRLTLEVPEFRLWSSSVGEQATRELIRAAVAELRGRHEATSGVRTDLIRRYEKQLERPILTASDVPGGVVLPTLRQGYVDPTGLASTAGPSDLPATEMWWEQAQPVPDVQSFLVSHLTTPQATDRPLVLLGQPGSGKSVLTRVLAARLTLADFLPIRVELRSVEANAPVQKQIEDSLYGLVGKAVSWPEVAHEAGTALPVVIMDGFDELLQATGQNWADYLERIEEFQQRENDLGRPLAVIVTSRTVVADRARFPAGTVVLRLNAFTDGQIGEWLEMWNSLNATRRGLSTEAVLVHRELASQPLLLLLLALYDSRVNQLRAGQGELRRADLYERLFTDFFERQVDKFGTGRDDEQRAAEIAVEWRRLSAVAISMLNRGRDVILEAELDEDLGHLLSDADRTPAAPNASNRPLSASQLLVGRFYFLHESRINRDTTGVERSFEFLHATFAEFLAARQIMTAMVELAEDRAILRRRPGATLDAGYFAALTSFGTLTRRVPLWEFCQGLVARLDAGRRRACRELAIELFAEAGRPHPSWTVAGYEPRPRTLAERQAMFSANLMCLIVLLSDGPVDAVEIVGEPVEINWRRHALLWLSQSSFDDARRLWQSLRVDWDLTADPPRLRIRLDDESDVYVFSSLPWPADRRPARVESQPVDGDIAMASESHAGRLLRKSAFAQTSLDSRELFYTMVPFWSRFGDLGFSDPDQRWYSDARRLTELAIGGLVEPNDPDRWTDYLLLLINEKDQMRNAAITQLQREAPVLSATLIQNIVAGISSLNADPAVVRSLVDLMIAIVPPGELLPGFVDLLSRFDPADQSRLRGAFDLPEPARRTEGDGRATDR